ncbi:polysaccharide biosynthesis C-terminal domain-containing protein [Flavobacterium sp. CBA20B-1]|uniref:lipopolysaccharide biosynthesis protein n=1 Tax=unclassified Flavobacterium TaxID=196869 RepID=UPI0022253BC9|nr:MULTISPECIES: polysaccharide biosynthesis C-terminal domain-containing protein [unclassified Flavobacterium]WCM43334.1 polysaccharide biosynthesis C-terminal domain-containing protein [Flavobacterium sp. CBA20B-1]
MNNRFSSKQALWFTLINYFGVLIGTVSTLFIYPNDKELLGIIGFIDGFAQVLYPVMVLGASTALLNFQPKLNEYLQRKLFSYSMISIIGMIFFCALSVLLIYWFNWLENKQYFIYGFAIAICLAFVDLFKRQATNLQKLSVPTFYEKIIPKISLPFAFALILYFGFTATKGLIFYTASFAVMLFAIGFYLFKYFKPVGTFNYKDLFQEIPKKQYYQYSLYAFSASLGSFFAFRIDSLMIPEFLSNAANGDFKLGVNLANTLMIPATGVFALYSPFISEALKKNDLSVLKIKYADVSKNLFFIGILLYGCVLLGMNDFFELLPTANQLIPVLPVLYILGGNVVLNMATGFNTEIIAYSKYYRFNLIAILILAVLNVGLNYYVLTQTNYGIIGVAWASFFSMTVFNLLKMAFIYKHFKMLPINANYIKTIASSLVLLLIAYFLPFHFLGKFAFVARCGFFALVFMLLIYQTGWVQEFNTNVDKIKKMFLKIK